MRKIIISAAILGMILLYGGLTNKRAAAVNLNQQVFTAAELKKYDGSDNNLPIYIGYQGLVYDVSAGKEFYRTGGPYHYLAGRDSTKELDQFGGAIIKRKYKIIGKLIL